MTDPDTPLVEATLRGDLRAFDTLVERHRDVVFRVTSRIVGSDEEAEDVTQDAFLRAFHRLERYRGDAPFRTWLLRIAHNAAVTYVTQSGRRAAQPLTDVAKDVGESVAPGGPADRARDRQSRRDREGAPAPRAWGVHRRAAAQHLRLGAAAMSEEGMTPAEERARALIAPLRESEAPHGDELVSVVGRTARWQRPVRRTLLAVGHAAIALGGGIGSLARGGRRR